MIPGVVKARPAVMADDLRWSLRTWNRCMGEIESAGKAKIDRDAGLVVLTNALIHRGIPRETARPNGENSRKAWLNSFDSLPKCALRDELGATLREFLRLCLANNSNDSGETPDDHVPDHPDTITDGVGTQEQKQDQEQEQKVERGEPAAPVAPPKPDPIADLWAEQNRLRAEVIPGSRPLPLTKDRRKRIRSLLDDGYSTADLIACQQACALEARSNGGGWFNGDTNWRPDNVARALGRIGSKAGSSTAAASRKPPPVLFPPGSS